ncbi:hypothetical protein EDB83DRAFT_2402612 [Lactarius deliciosus]|nr:hypothetical protein EDB83DRAFT_2402612 [Lactarius deliciosus]
MWLAARTWQGYSIGLFLPSFHPLFHLKRAGHSTLGRKFSDTSVSLKLLSLLKQGGYSESFPARGTAHRTRLIPI